MATPGADPLVGTVVGSFRITKAIGRGGMGAVYLGEHAVIGSRVAIKVLHEKLAADENLVARFYAEARAVNLIGHENIVNIFDMNVVPPNRYYLVMEYLEGRPLNYLLTRPVPTDVAVPILVQVCDALAAAHQANIVHRDLKPENIFLTKRGRTNNFVKVLDFGLAKLFDQKAAGQQTAAGLIVGTPEFMSPEQANSAPVDGRSDIYSLGCIAWLMATARLPFTQRGLTDLLVAHRQMMPPPPHTVVPSVPKAMSEVIMRAIQKRPEDRYPDAAALGRAFDEALSKTGAAPSPRRTPEPPPPPPQVRAGTPRPAPGAPPQKRHAASFDAVVTTVEGAKLGKLACRDISRGGMFLVSDGPHPPLFSRLKISLTNTKLDLLAEVVRHVPADQAAAWGIAMGFGVQFLDLTPPLRAALAAIIDKLPEDQPVNSSPSGLEDPQAEKVLSRYRARVAGDHYEMLGLELDADFPKVMAAAREALRELEAFSKKKLPEPQRAQLEAALARVRTAEQVLGGVLPRAEYDANRQNHRGVSRCLAAGLSETDLERLRGTYLNAHPGASGGAYVKFLASKAYESKGQHGDAVEACEAALHLDPLSLQFHQRLKHLNAKKGGS